MGVDEHFQSFAAALKSRRHRSALLVLFAWLLLGQTLLVVHSVDHAKAERGAPCTLCVAGSHMAGAAAPPAHAIARPTPDVIESIISGGVAVAFRAAYRSRAPPPYLRS